MISHRPASSDIAAVGGSVTRRNRDVGAKPPPLKSLYFDVGTSVSSPGPLDRRILWYCPAGLYEMSTRLRVIGSWPSAAVPACTSCVMRPRKSLWYELLKSANPLIVEDVWLRSPSVSNLRIRPTGRAVRVLEIVEFLAEFAVSVTLVKRSRFLEMSSVTPCAGKSWVARFARVLPAQA